MESLKIFLDAHKKIGSKDEKQTPEINEEQNITDDEKKVALSCNFF